MIRFINKDQIVRFSVQEHELAKGYEAGPTEKRITRKADGAHFTLDPSDTLEIKDGVVFYRPHVEILLVGAEVEVMVFKDDQEMEMYLDQGVMPALKELGFFRIEKEYLVQNQK